MGKTYKESKNRWEKFERNNSGGGKKGGKKNKSVKPGRRQKESDSDEDISGFAVDFF